MDELRAELDGEGQAGLVLGEDAPADAVARLDDGDTPARAGKLTRGGETRGARADDDGVGTQSDYS